MSGHPYAAPPCGLRVRFDKPGFFIGDVRLTIRLDGAVVYDGSFLSGVDVAFEIAPGPHRLETRIDLGGIGRSRAYDLVLHAPGHWVATLEYSRFWGNFSRSLALRHA